MGYRAEWITHDGAVAVHNEIALAAFDREIPPRPLRMLLAGIGNGGAVEVWRKTLPEGSTVTALDKNPACAELIGVGDCVITCDITDMTSVRDALRGRWFDCIIDATGTMSPHTWPFLAPGGTLHYETYDPDLVIALARDIAAQVDSWLPIEEVMRLDIYSHIAVIEKRNPIVVPPMRVLTGNFADLMGEAALHEAGVKRAIFQ